MRLLMPMPAEPFTHCAPGCPSHDSAASHFPEPPADEESRASYRWLLGHQVAIAVWRHLGEHLAAMRPGLPSDAAVQLRAARLYDVYSSMFVYAASCSPETYHSAIRVRMATAAPGFSGTWARDYEYVLKLIRDLRLDKTGPLKQAMLSNRTVHMSVADRLVPSGVSLLREVGRPSEKPPTDTDRAIFDAFFDVVRGPVCRAAFDNQLQRRIEQVVADLESYPDTVQYRTALVNEAQQSTIRRLQALLSTLSPVPASVSTREV